MYKVYVLCLHTIDTNPQLNLIKQHLWNNLLSYTLLKAYIQINFHPVKHWHCFRILINLTTWTLLNSTKGFHSKLIFVIHKISMTCPFSKLHCFHTQVFSTAVIRFWGCPYVHKIQRTSFQAPYTWFFWDVHICTQYISSSLYHLR